MKLIKHILLCSTLLTSYTSLAANFDLKMKPDGNNVIVMTGKIVEGDNTKFEQLISSAPSNTSNVIFLNSQGGDLLEAIYIGMTISHLNTDTVVFGHCVSACAIIFASGNKKYVPKMDLGFGEGNNKVGVHVPFVTIAGEKYEQRPESKHWWLIYGLLRSSGMTKQQALLFLNKKYSTSSDSIYFINYSNAEQFGFINK